MTSRQGALMLHAVPGSGRLGTAWRTSLWLAVCVLAVVTAYGLVERDGWLAEIRGYALGLAVAVLLVALVLRRHLGAVVAFACGAVQAVWLMPVLLAPSVAVGDVPDGATRVASIDKLVAGQEQGRAFATADGLASSGLVVALAGRDGVVHAISVIPIRQVAGTESDFGVGSGSTDSRWAGSDGAGAVGAPPAAMSSLPIYLRLRAAVGAPRGVDAVVPARSAVPLEAFAVRVRNDGAVLIQWLGHAWSAEETPGTDARPLPLPQRT